MAEEWDVFALQPGGEYAQPEYLATLYSAYQKSIRVELNNTGSGSFAINRTSPECTETILAQGNLVKVRIPEIDDDYIFAFFLETGDFTLVSSQERGGEMLTFGGRGNLSYLEYARGDRRSYIDGGQDPIAGVWRAYAAGTGAAPGQILRRLLEEFQHEDRVYGVAESHPIPLVTIDFDYEDDSTGDPWDETDATDEFSYQVGEDGLAITLRLIETDTIIVQMGPDFLLSAYNPDNFGRDLTGDAFGAGAVRFERGVNIAVELRRQLSEDRVVTHDLVQGEADKYGGAVLADAASRVTKEGFLQQFGTGTTALNGLGAADLADRLRKSDRIEFQIANRRTAVELAAPVSVGATVGAVATDGFYLPGPEGTLGDFWVGDRVRVHTGSGPFDYTEVNAVVEAITISRDDDNAELIVIPELTEPEPLPAPQLVAFLAGSMNANPTESLLSSGPAWQAAHAYTVGEIVGGMRPGHTYECTVAGTSGGSGPTWPDGGTVTDGTVTWRDLGAIWTQRYWSDDISNVAQFPGPGDQQWMGIYTRAIRDVGETVNVLTVERGSGSSGFTGAWVYELGGLSWADLTVIAGKDTVLPDTGAGNITPANPATDVNISAVASVDSVLFGGMSMQKVNYGEGTVFTGTDGTELINASTKNLATACSAHDGSPPWSWAGYATGTGTLTIGGTITSSGANGCANGYNLMGRGFCALLIPIDTSFSIIQSAHNSSDPIQRVVFASPPTP